MVTDQTGTHSNKYDKKLQKISKRQSTKCRDGALEADKVHKQGKHIPQHATLLTTIPIYISIAAYSEYCIN